MFDQQDEKNPTIFFCLPAASVDAGHVPSEWKAVTEHGTYSQRSAGFHPSPAGGWQDPLMQSQKQSRLCKHSRSKAGNNPPLVQAFALQILYWDLLFFRICCKKTSSSSWGRQTSPSNRELITACTVFWAAVSVQNFKPLTPRLGKCKWKAAKRSGASELNTLRNIMKNADRNPLLECKPAETARTGVREWGNGKRFREKGNNYRKCAKGKMRA